MLSRSICRRIGSTFGVLAASSGMMSFNDASNALASKEFLSSNFLQAILNEISDGDIKEFDCERFWNNQSEKEGVNVKNLESKKLLTLIRLKKFAEFNVDEKNQKDEQKRCKARALKRDVDTVLQGNMKEKIKEFFRSDFFKDNCIGILNKCYTDRLLGAPRGELGLVKSSLFSKEFEVMFSLARGSSKEDVVTTLTSTDYKGVFCNEKGEYDKDNSVRRFSIFNSFYTLLLEDLNIFERFDYREILFFAKTFSAVKGLLVNNEKEIFKDLQTNKDFFVSVIKFAKSFIEGKFFSLERVLSAIKIIGAKLAECDGAKRVMDTIEKSKLNGLPSDITRKVVLAMSDNWMVLDKLINSQDNTLACLSYNNNSSYFTYVNVNPHSEVPFSLPTAIELFKNFIDPIFAESRSAF